MKTFAEIFCEKHRINPTDFERTVLKRTLHPAARVLWPLLSLSSDYFIADREFIRCVGRITRARQFEAEAFDFATDSNGRGFLHYRLKLRVSRSLLGRLVRKTFSDYGQ